jgi:glycerol-3-phosphate dehydrogenase
VRTAGGVFCSRWVVNCAGLGSARVSSMLGIDDYTVYPCRGEYLIFDQNLGPLLPLPAYPVPNYKTGGLGIHITPSVDGNILVGPSTEYIGGCGDYACTQRTIDLLLEDGSRIFPYLDRAQLIGGFSGIRPKLAPKDEGGYRDFVVERRPEAPHAVNLVGIESPGLTSAVPLAREVIRLMQEIEDLSPNADFDPVRRGAPSLRGKTPGEQRALIAEDPDYGEIICRCETVTKAEVLRALRGPLPARTLAGVKARCRAMMGRCQGGYCQTRIVELMMREQGRACEDILYNRPGSYLFTGAVRGK